MIQLSITLAYTGRTTVVPRGGQLPVAAYSVTAEATKIVVTPRAMIVGLGTF